MSPAVEPPTGVQPPRSAPPLEPDDLQRLAASVAASSRVSIRFRRDGIFEVSVATGVIGFVDYVAPIFVALSGTRLSRSVEVAQRRTLASAVEQLRRANAG